MIRSRIEPDWILPPYLVESIDRPVDGCLQVEARLLLALSGGQDSMVLFSLLLQERKQIRCKVHLCWCNHLWHSDAFYAMHHLMRLSLIVEEAISFLLEPTNDPPPPKKRGGRWKEASASPLVKRCNSEGEVDGDLSQGRRRRQPFTDGDGHHQGGERSLITFYAGLLSREQPRPPPFPERFFRKTGKTIHHGGGGAKLAVPIVSPTCHLSYLSSYGGWAYRQRWR